MARDNDFDRVRDTDAFTSDVLIESVERRASIPLHQSNFNQRDILAFANEEMSLDLVPHILSHHEDFFLFEIELDVDNTTRSYEIPSRAIGNKLRDVQHKVGRDYIELTRVGIGTRFEDEGGVLQKYYIKNNKVVFLNTSDLGNTNKVAMIFYIKPSRLVMEDRVGIIAGIDRVTGEVVLDEIPDIFNSNIKYDFYKGGSPHSILSIDLTSNSINPSTRSVFFDPDKIPEDLVVGDHLSKAGECIIPQVPTDLHVMLAQMVSCRVLEAQGDSQGLANAMAKLDKMKKYAGMLIDNRVEDSPRKIINRNGVVRSAVYRKYYNRGN